MLPSDAVDTDLVESDDAVDGVELDRSRRGHAPRARPGMTLGDGEDGRICGDVGMLEA